jgi:hypothetical protein
MDKKKILLVNLSQGRTGELNSQMLGMIFVMKFQAAAMGRANIPEDQREDFSLYVDEFQNFATDSFEAILSQARKYRLSLILANQFMTQLNDKVREAVIGNVGTIISGRIGTTDAEILIKKFRPTFDEEDLTKLPNFEAVASVMINNVPSVPFSMTLIPPLGKPSSQLSDALKRLSAAKYGRPRAQVEQEIFKRLRSGAGESSTPKPVTSMSDTNGSALQQSGNSSTTPSFLDEWLAKRKQKLEASVSEGSVNKSTAPSSVQSAPNPIISTPESLKTPAVQEQAMVSEPILKIERNTDAQTTPQSGTHDMKPQSADEIAINVRDNSR